MRPGEMKQINSRARLLSGFLVAVAAISLALGATAAAAPPKPLSARLAAAVDEAVEAEMRRQQLIGVAVGIIRHGEVVLTKGYGLADREQKIPVTTETVFNWASNSKPLAAVAAMQLVQKKKLDLDADVRRYVPEFSPNGPRITVRQLLCHQSGLPHWNNGRVVPSPDLDAKALASIDPLMSVRRFSQTPLLFEPGARMSYSSYGYILLSAVIERAGGASFYTQIEKRIARPLGLESLQLDTAETQPNWAAGYTRTKDRAAGQSETAPIHRAPEYAHAWKAGAGCYKSNIGDFAKWAAALLNGRLVSKSIERQMWTRQKTTSGTTSSGTTSSGTTSSGTLTDAGLGFFIGRWAGSPTIFHSGEQPETTSHLILFPKPKNGIVLLCNCSYAKTAELTKAVAIALGEQ
jgi:CubicO group peptidase (beta-lactamase class C family)